MAFHTSYRPKDLKDFIGNEKTVLSLEALFKKNRVPHAFLFVGPKGCGKTTLGRIVANKLGCIKGDFIEMNSADFRGIDTVRDLIRQVRLKPMFGKVRVWLFDECHKMTADAQAALLKVLEEPPAHVYFVLSTTDPQKLIDTVRDRCVTYTVNTLDSEQILGMLGMVLEKEGYEGRVPKDVLEAIVDISEGFPRVALLALEKVVELPSKEMHEALKHLVIDESEIIDLCRALVQKKGWKDVSKILKGLMDKDMEHIRRTVLNYCNTVLLKEDNPRMFLIIDSFKQPFWNGKSDLTRVCYEALNG